MSERLGTFSSANQAFQAACYEIMRRGGGRESRGMPHVELSNVTFDLDDPRNRIITARPINVPYLGASLAWNLAQRDDVEGICWWNEHGRKISDDGVRFHGANYGQRMLFHVWNAIQLIARDPDTRRAWVPIWDPTLDRGEYLFSGKDVPCTIGFNLSAIMGHLDMHVIMRSQSVYGVLPYDIFLFTALQELIANELDLKLGIYSHTMMSAHVYERELELLPRINHSSGKRMEELPTLSRAQQTWPLAFDEIMAGKEPSARDPLIDLMRVKLAEAA